MATLDKIPSIVSSRPFPIGDVVNAEKERMANEWLSSLDELEYRQFIQKIRKAFAQTALTGLSGTYRSHRAAIELCEEWDSSRGNGRDMASKGYMVAAAFKNDTSYLTSYNVDFSEVVKTMREEQRYMAPYFAHTAWTSMRQYDHVHDKFDRLYEHSMTRFQIHDGDDLAYFRAGMAMPFMLSMASNLVKETPEFNGMVTKKQNLRTTDFREFFTNNAISQPAEAE